MTKEDKVKYINGLIAKKVSEITKMNKELEKLKFMRGNIGNILIGQGYCPDPDFYDDGMRVIMVGDVIGTKYGDCGKVTYIDHEKKEIFFINQENKEDSVNLCRVT